MAEIMVRFQPTPNPNAGKFITDRVVVADGRAKQYASAAEAEAQPVAAALLRLDEVASVFMVDDFITVTKRADVDWVSLIPVVEETIRANLQ